jgi:hypothetical protein
LHIHSLNEFGMDTMDSIMHRVRELVARLNDKHLCNATHARMHGTSHRFRLGSHRRAAAHYSDVRTPTQRYPIRMDVNFVAACLLQQSTDEMILCKGRAWQAQDGSGL